MELTYDWRSFQQIFYPHRKQSAVQVDEVTSPIFVLKSGDSMIEVFTEQEDLSEWVGKSVSEVAIPIKNREIIVLDIKSVNLWVEEALSFPHFYDQVEFLRGKISNLPGHRHFLLEAIRSSWSKVFPSSYGIFIRVAGQTQQDLLLLIKRGALDGFLEPDLASLGRERQTDPEAIVKYLSEKHLVPIQGIFVTATEWFEWSESKDPWKKIAQSVRANRAKLVPFRWGIAMWIAGKAFLRIASIKSNKKT